MRKNTVTWVDCKVITQRCHVLVETCMEYVKFTDENGMPGQNNFLGDSQIIINAIYLRDKLNQIIEKNPN